MAKKWRFRKYTVPAYIKVALDTLKPPENITVSEWAEAHRILTSKASNIAGSWRNSVTPYLVGIMDEFNNWETEEIVFVKPSQVGATETEINMLGYIIDQDPAPTMVVYPADDLARSVRKNRIIPAIMDAKTLRTKYDDRNSGDNELQFRNDMYIALVGSNSPGDLASRPIRFLFLDEIDKYPEASKKEADPINLARERTKTFKSNRKIYYTSTPTLRTGHIWKLKEGADAEKHYFVPCPHCGRSIELKFAQIKWPGSDTGMSDADRAELASYICQECGGIITDQHKPAMLRQGEWRIVTQRAQIVRRVAFWINTLYSPFTRFSDIAREFLKGKNDPDAMHNFINSWLAEPWEDTKLKTSAELVQERQTDLDAYVVPEWAKALTAGVDVQENCLYWTIRAWGDFLTSQNIAHGQAFSFAEITRIMNLEYHTPSGNPFLVALALIDSGDQTDAVYDYCAINIEWALPCKGTAAMLSHYKLSTVNKSGSKAFGMNLVLVDGGKYKDMIASRMRRENGQGSWMVHKGVDLEYCEQVTAEHKVATRNANGKETLTWTLKESHADNHYLDAEVYAMAAADVMGVRSFFLQNNTPAEPGAAPPPPPKPREQPQENSWLPQTGDGWLK